MKKLFYDKKNGEWVFNEYKTFSIIRFIFIIIVITVTLIII